MTLSVRALLSVGFAAFILFLVLLMPANLALSLTGANTFLGYQEAQGSIWNARLLGAQVRGRPLGTMDLSISPLTLMTGNLSADVRFGGGGKQGSFALKTGSVTEIDRLDLVLDVSAVLGPAALNGVLTVRGGSFTYDGGRCTAGRGAVRSNILESGFAAMGVTAPVLAGDLSCMDGKPAFTLAGENDLLSISASGVFTGARRPTADILLAFKDARLVTDDLKSALEFAGLRESNEGWRGRLNLEL